MSSPSVMVLDWPVPLGRFDRPAPRIYADLQVREVTVGCSLSYITPTGGPSEFPLKSITSTREGYSAECDGVAVEEWTMPCGHTEPTPLPGSPCPAFGDDTDHDATTYEYFTNAELVAARDAALPAYPTGDDQWNTKVSVECDCDAGELHAPVTTEWALVYPSPVSGNVVDMSASGPVSQYQTRLRIRVGHQNYVDDGHGGYAEAELDAAVAIAEVNLQVQRRVYATGAPTVTEETVNFVLDSDGVSNAWEPEPAGLGERVEYVIAATADPTINRMWFVPR